MYKSFNEFCVCLGIFLLVGDKGKTLLKFPGEHPNHIPILPLLTAFNTEEQQLY